ncbi:MAG: NAD(P)/FAD-dependent oxidoreductase [Planctomycetes bacterium]|nr:NAD(P)/FAD-dependent oxidoreductase [Planctomycetota bacterium]
MERVDVLIVGGGPAGSSCAWKLQQSGIDVLVLDKARFPRHKVCAGWITPQILDDLKLDVADYQSRLIMQPITRFLTGLIGGPEIVTEYGTTVSYGIRRCEFDDYLLMRSQARLKLGESVHSLHRDGSDWVVNDHFRAPIVIGAGGHFCPVARHVMKEFAAHSESAAEVPPDLPVVLAQEVEFEMTAAEQDSCSVLPDRPELFFCPDLKGYGWVFRKGNFLNVGLGREGEEHLSGHVTEFVAFLRQRHKIEFDLPGKFQGHAYRLRTHLPRSHSTSGIILIGDAVGLADRQSGEGIRPAIESGLLCAESITEFAPDQVAAQFQTKLEAHFQQGTESSALSNWIPASLRQFAARRLLCSRWFTRHVLLDQWFLHRSKRA